MARAKSRVSSMRMATKWCTSAWTMAAESLPSFVGRPIWGREHLRSTRRIRSALPLAVVAGRSSVSLRGSSDLEAIDLVAFHVDGPRQEPSVFDADGNEVVHLRLDDGCRVLAQLREPA